MTSIIYKIIADFGECRDFIGDGSSYIRIKVDGADYGHIVIGNIGVPLKCGIARISLSSLPDGEYSPYLFTEGRRIQLERIRKSGDKLSRPSLDAELLARLLIRLEALEGEVKSLNKRTEKTEAMVNPRPLFG